jgi:hypothetical protein
MLFLAPPPDPARVYALYERECRAQGEEPTMLPSDLLEMGWWYRYLMELNRRELDRERNHHQAAWQAVLSLPARFAAWIDETVKKIGTAMLPGTPASPVRPANDARPPAAPCSERKRRWSWAEGVAFDWFDSNGVPVSGDGKLAKLEKHIRGQWRTEFGAPPPDEATVRRYASNAWIPAYRSRSKK